MTQENGDREDELSTGQQAVAEQAVAGLEDAAQYLNVPVVGPMIRNYFRAQKALDDHLDPEKKATYIQNYIKNNTDPDKNSTRRPPTEADAEAQWKLDLPGLTAAANSTGTAARAALAEAKKTLGIYPTQPRSEGQEEQAQATARAQRASARGQELINEEIEANIAAGRGPVTNAQRLAQDAQIAANATAQKRLEIEELYRTGQLSLEQSTFEYRKWFDEQESARKAADAAAAKEKELRGYIFETWKTEETNAANRYAAEATAGANKYRGDVDQRQQDITAVTSAANTMADLIGKSLPFRAPPGTTAAFNKLMASMGGYGGPESAYQSPVASFESVMGPAMRAPTDYVQGAFGGAPFPAQINYTPPPMPTPQPAPDWSQYFAQQMPFMAGLPPVPEVGPPAELEPFTDEEGNPYYGEFGGG